MMNRIITVFGFDMETDIGSWTPYYNGLKFGTYRVLKVLEEKGVHSTCFFTGDSALQYPEIVRDVATEGHEVGCHSLYHETMGDELFEIPGIKPLLKEEIPLRIAVATRHVEEALEGKIVSFRAPRLWGSTALVNALEDAGYVADASYPLYFYRERLAPYHPARDDWTREGDMKIVEIPNFADLAMESRDPYGRDRDQWPLFRTKSSVELMEHVVSYTRYATDRGVDPVVLCFYFHPWEFEEMPRGLIHFGEGSVLPDEMITKGCGNYAVEQLGELVEMLKGVGAEFSTVRELALAY